MPAYELKAALAKVRQQPWNFALYRGEDDNQLLVSAQPPSPKLLAEIVDECGEGKRLLKGVCYLEGEQLVFATRVQPAPAWEKLIAQVLKQRGCAKYNPIALRLLPADSPDEVGEAEGPTAGTSADGADAAKAKWERSKSVLVPVIKEAMAKKPAAKAELAPLLAEALQHERAGDFASAMRAFERLAPVLKAALAGAPVAPEIALPPLGPLAPAATPGRLTGALNRLAPVLASRLREKPERKGQIGAVIKKFHGAVTGGEWAVAKSELARLCIFLRESAPQP